LTRAEADTVAWTAAVTVALSIVLHGVTASKLRERWLGD
jgi:hypothetical protein